MTATTIHVSRGDADQLTKILRARRKESTTIVLEAGEYLIDLCAIIGPVTIVGSAGARHTTIKPIGGGELLKVSRAGSVLSIRGITFEDGQSPAGAAIDATGETSVLVEDCIFRNNVAKAIKGGAIHASASVELTVKRCVFESNRSECGGAIALTGNARGTIHGSVFHGNQAVLGGAVIVEQLAQATITSCSFFNNEANHHAGGNALFVSGTRTSQPNVKLTNSLFVAERPIVNNPQRPGELMLSHCIVPPTSLDDVKHRDIGGTVALDVDLIEHEPGLMALRPGSPGSGIADVSEIPEGMSDILGRALVTNGHADPGALASG
jgi:predicted outer membrane repeat protein